MGTGFLHGLAGAVSRADFVRMKRAINVMGEYGKNPFHPDPAAGGRRHFAGGPSGNGGGGPGL